MAQMKHSGGIVDAVLELGFDTVKYFEGDIGTAVSGFNISPPARRLILNNKSQTGTIYLRIDGQNAQPTTSFTPGDNIKIGPSGSFAMDFDALSSISLVSDIPGTHVEGILGWKGTVG